MMLQLLFSTVYHVVQSVGIELELTLAPAAGKLIILPLDYNYLHL